MVTRRGLFGASAAVGIGGLLGAGAGEEAARAATASTAYGPITVPHLAQAEQLVQYQRMLAAGYLADGLVGWWPLDGSAAERSGLGQPVTAGSGTTWTALRAGGELSFDGTTAAYATTGSVLDTTGAFTVAAWVRLSKTASLTDKIYTAVSQDGAVTSRFLLQYDPDLGWAFKVRSADEQKKSAKATTAAALDTWVHLAGVSEGSVIRLYVNGVLEATTEQSYAWAATEGFSIGRAKYAGAYVNRWDGSISDVRAYDRALTAAEVALISGRTARQNNVYTHETASVLWGAPGDPTGWVAHADCSSLVTTVLQRCYPWATDDYFATYFGDHEPEAAEYRKGIDTDPGARFARIRKVADLRPGDLIAVDYQATGSGNTGHIVMVRQVKGVYTGSGTVSGETQYAVEIIDTTSAPHGVYGLSSYAAYPDSRVVDDVNDFTGVGIGHMMFYAANATGEFSRYRWSANAGDTYDVSARPIAAARIV